ncbi:MAG TPA: NUDIX domain-containing protein [Acidimicrobiales bacterium]|nr:NUDIX domain-containing protein [Acidimicrobiales bacterium]
MSAPRASHVRVLALDPDGRVLLARRRDPVSRREVWEPPGGAVDPGEDLADAAERELLEETGIAMPVCALRWSPVHREYEWNGEHRRRDEAVCVVHVAGAKVRPRMSPAERASFLEWRWWSIGELADAADEVYPSDLAAIVGADQA